MPSGPFAAHPPIPPATLPPAFGGPIDSQKIEILPGPPKPPSSLVSDRFGISRMDAEDDDQKPGINSSRAASWEKFREKNPEFKKYQKVASVTGWWYDMWYLLRHLVVLVI